MFQALVEREADAVDRMTIAVATGTAIAWGGKDAMDAWQRGRDHTEGADPAAERIAAQSATLGSLAAMFPGAVKARTN
jgi:hypothetical protein